MTKQVAILFGVYMHMVLFCITGLASEMTPEEFIRQFSEAVENEDNKKIGQLIQQNHKIAAQVMQTLQEKEDTAEMNRLQKEGEKTFQAANYPEALAKWEKGLELAKKSGNEQAISVFLCNIGIVYCTLGQYEKSLSYFEQALTIKRKIDDRWGESSVLSNIGNTFQNLGQYEKSLSYFEQALMIKREIGDRKNEGTDLSNIGSVYDNIGQYEKSVFYFEQALTIRREIGDRRGQSATLSKIGNVFQDLGQYEKSLSYFEQALTIRKEIGDKRGQSADFSNIGNVFQFLGQYEKALFYHNQAMRISSEIGDIQAEGADLSNIGKVFYNLGQYEKARQFFDRSMTILLEIGTPDALWIAQRGLANTEVVLNRYEDAIRHYEKALDNLETVRANLSESRTKISFMHSRIYVYGEFIKLLKNLHKNDSAKGYGKKAFEIFERKQGRIFVEEMGKSGARHFADFPDDMRQKETDLLNEFAETRAELAQERSSPSKDRNMKRARQLEQRLETLKTGMGNMETKIKQNYPGYHAMKYPKPVTLKDLQKAVLQSGEVMLIYEVMEKTTCLWVLSKKEFAFFPIDVSEKTLSEKVGNFRKGADTLTRTIKVRLPDFRFRPIYRKSMKKMHQSARELYEMLIPAKARPVISKAENLYIIPTLSLYGLPFEALITQTDEKSGVRYLIESCPITYLSSASLLKIIRDARARKKEKAKYPLLAFAHPVYKTTANNETHQMSSKRQDKNNLVKNRDSVRDLRTRTYLDIMGERFLKELPESEKEAIEIRNILNAPDESEPLQLRQKASRSNVLNLHKNRRLDDYQNVLFSCHGILPGKVEYLEQPALVLSHPDPETGEDGYLTMADVFGIRFNADMITLSACNTGRGKEIRGEGVMGLTRAFMYAGTPAVSVTLWEVESRSSKILSTGLYENLKTGKNRAEALQSIKCRMIRGEKGKLFRHPYFWSPVVIFGNAR